LSSSCLCSPEGIFLLLAEFHHLGSNKQWQMTSVNPHLPHQGKGKGGKGKETYKLEI